MGPFELRKKECPRQHQRSHDEDAVVAAILLRDQQTYTHPIDSIMDHELQCVLRNPSVDAIVKFENRMARGTTTGWTLSMAETLLSGIQKRPQLMYLLAKADMDDHIIYAVQQHLPILTEQALQEQSRPLSMVAVVRVWEALERVRSFSSSLTVDTLWMYSHVEPRKLIEMAHVAVHIITRYE